MRFVLERVTQPEIEPVSAAEFIRNIGEFQEAATTRADDITGVIAAAREWAEKDTGRALIDQKWRLTLSDAINGYDSVQTPSAGCMYGTFTPVAGEILLRRSPIIAITSFVSVDATGAETEIDPDAYELREADSKWPKIVSLNGAAWSRGAYRLEYRAGYADRESSPQQAPDVVPSRFRRAILLYAEALYDRDDRMEALMQAAWRLIEAENCNTGLA